MEEGVDQRTNTWVRRECRQTDRGLAFRDRNKINVSASGRVTNWTMLPPALHLAARQKGTWVGGGGLEGKDCIILKLKFYQTKF
jgi:hypothetical protein